MANNDYPQISYTRKVFTYPDARRYEKHLNSKPTIGSRSWCDVKTGGTVVFIGV